MIRLEWRSIKPKEGTRDFEALARRWYSRASPPVAPSPWDQASRPEEPWARVIADADVSIVFFAGHGFAQGSHILLCERKIWSHGAQSEPGVANWEDLLKIEATRASCGHCCPWRCAVQPGLGRNASRRISPISNPGSEGSSRYVVASFDRRRSIRGIPPRLQQSRPPVESAEAEAEGADPESRCRAIVESLRRPDLEHEERRKLILKAEVLPFRGQHAAALVPLLRQFIETYRESNVPADLVAVGSAIRNYVATAASDDAFEAAASLLKATR